MTLRIERKLSTGWEGDGRSMYGKDNWWRIIHRTWVGQEPRPPPGWVNSDKSLNLWRLHAFTCNLDITVATPLAYKDERRWLVWRQVTHNLVHRGQSLLPPLLSWHHPLSPGCHISVCTCGLSQVDQGLNHDCTMYQLFDFGRVIPSTPGSVLKSVEMGITFLFQGYLWR